MNLCESCTTQWPVSLRQDVDLARSFMQLSGIAEPEHRRTMSWSSWWKAGARARSYQIRQETLLTRLHMYTCLVMHSRPTLLKCLLCKTASPVLRRFGTCTEHSTVPSTAPAGMTCTATRPQHALKELRRARKMQAKTAKC